MAQPPAHADDMQIVTGDTGVAVLELRGEIDISNVGELRDRLEQLSNTEPVALVDLSDVSFLASVGVRALVEVVRREKCRILLVTGPAVRTILDICGVPTLVRCHTDRGAAERDSLR
jgi:anti-sigma B factor antagonist